MLSIIEATYFCQELFHQIQCFLRKILKIEKLTNVDNEKFAYLVAGWWFSPGILDLVSSTNKTDHHQISEILLEVTLNTITRNPLTSKL
jgi:hypothetical protein